MPEPCGAPRGAAPLDGALVAELESFFAELDAELEGLAASCSRCGCCCNFPVSGHLLFAEELEARYALAVASKVEPENAAAGLCPFFSSGSCQNRAGRPLGCRTFFCEGEARTAGQELHERFLARLRTIACARGLELSYRPFLGHLEALVGPRST